jgi:putative tryptophan/tyrosine transport system substrate-binding protein
MPFPLALGKAVRRREFIALLAASALPLLTARAQQTTKVYRIAILDPSRRVAKMVGADSLK